jgi:putative membrane protein insertion efficiency factor
VRRIALALIRGYQRYLSPLKRPTCRFLPTCSEYAYEAIAHYGVVRGGLKALWRLLRCQPFCAGGYDPVLPAPHVCGQLEAREEAK